MVRGIRYSFSQVFGVSARRAFEWCTDYSPDDMTLMQKENATRQIQRISEDTIILIDIFASEERNIVKQKLVCLYPDRLMWTSTHLTGPNKHSQFLYEITPQTEGQSCLKFTALALDYDVKNDEEAEELARKLKKMDSETWKLLAKRMKEDIDET